MTEKELVGKIHSSVYNQCQTRGYAAPVDVLMDIGVLSKAKYEEWRFGHVYFCRSKGIRNMTVHDLQPRLLKLQEEGLRLMQLCTQYPWAVSSSIPGYDAWLNNLYQYEQRYLSGHQIHERFQLGFGAAGNPRVGLERRAIESRQNKRQWRELKENLSVARNGTIGNVLKTVSESRLIGIPP